MNSIDIAALQAYLHQQIPLSRAMGITVRAASAERVELQAPIAPNINHESTVFGGSASAVAILSAWTLVYLRLQAAGLPGRVVIQANTMQYQQPMTGEFSAITLPIGPEEDIAWQRCFNAVRRKRMARIMVGAMLECGGESTGRLEGSFVVLPAA